MKPNRPRRTDSETEAGGVMPGTPRERRLILGVLALSLIVVPIAFGYVWSPAGLNDIGCAIAIAALLPFAWRAERWFAQPTMIVGGWLLLSDVLFRHAEWASFTDLLVGSFVIMASTNGPPGSHLRSIGGRRS